MPESWNFIVPKVGFSMTSRKRPNRLFFCLTVAGLAIGSVHPAFAQRDDGKKLVLKKVNPPIQRVGERVTIRGQGFGSFDSRRSRVRFIANERFIYTATLPYTWRDDLIEVDVPAGDLLFGERPVPISFNEFQIQVETAAGLSAQAPNTFTTLCPGGTLGFTQKPGGDLANPDNNSDPNQNQARTKDGEVGDIDNDGWDDLLDNNSNNISNGTHAVMRTNNGTGSFTATWFEPLFSGEPGPFVASTTNFFGNGVTYDADFADINNDGTIDLLHTATISGTNMVRVFTNSTGSPGTFTEDATAMPPNPFGMTTGCPDDLAHADLDCDGWIDFGITLRDGGACTGGATSDSRLFLNKGPSQAGKFDNAIVLPTPSGGSSHDLFFFDMNSDMAPDVFVVNESGGSRLFQHNGNFSSPAWPTFQSFSDNGFAGDSADFNGDGELDFVVAGRTGGPGTGYVKVYLNSTASPGTFNAGTNLPNALGGAHYDIELGDLDLDCDIDIISAAIPNGGTVNLKIYLNDGNANFTDVTSTVITGIGTTQRLSADLIDFDNDGDLDLYLTGPDGGTAANQLFENTIN